MPKLKQLFGLQTNNECAGTGACPGFVDRGVSRYLRAVRAAGIGAADAESLSEAECELRVFGPITPTKVSALVAPDCVWIHRELIRRRHVTLQLLWEEYAERYGEAAYQRSAFCAIHRRWEKRLKRSMRQRLGVCRSDAHSVAAGRARKPRSSTGVLRRGADHRRAG